MRRKVIVVDRLKRAWVILRDYRRDFLILTLGGVAAALFEGIGVNTLIPIFSLATGDEYSGDDAVTEFVSSAFASIGIPFELQFLLVFVLVLFVLKAAVLFYSHYLRVAVTADFEKRMREQLFAAALASSWPHLLRQKIGYLENMLMTDVRFAATILQKASNIIMAVTGLIVAAGIAFNISARITLLSLFVGLILVLIFSPFNKKIRVSARETGRYNKDVAHFVNENVIGMKTLKTSIVERPITVRIGGYFEALRKLKIRLSLLKTSTSVLMQPFSLIFIVIIFALSYQMPDFHLASFFVVMYLVQRIFHSTGALQSNLYTIHETVPFFETVERYLRDARAHVETEDGTQPFALEESLVFTNVSFGYDGGERVLSDLSFGVGAREMVGLVGASGAGKTTVVDLILRLLKPISGVIYADGVPIGDVSLHGWRKNIGYVSQDIFLANDTVAHNIRFFNPEVDQRKMSQAAQDAYIYDVIQRLPQKFDTVIGERGIHLSAGERQRIVLARVLAQGPKFLILDEATSALDRESEANIKSAIEGLRGKIPIFVIAHRLETVMNCDKLLVLQGGRIVEEGRPHELLKNTRSVFYHLYYVGL